MSATEIEDSGVLLPRLAGVRALDRNRIAVEWAAGERAGKAETVDLSPVIDSYRIYRPLRGNAALFATVRVIDGGDAIAWDGADLELPTQTIESLAWQMMRPEEFVAFMQRHRLTEAAIATILGYSRRQIGYFKTTGPIPRVVALACKGYVAEQRERGLRGGHHPVSAT